MAFWLNANIWAGHSPAHMTHSHTRKLHVQEVSSRNPQLAPNGQIRTSVASSLKVLHVLFYTILRQTHHTSLIPYEQPARSRVSLHAWYSCGMGPGAGQGLKGRECLFTCHFELHVIQNMSRTEQQALTQRRGGHCYRGSACTYITNEITAWMGCVFMRQRLTGWSRVRHVIWDRPSLSWVSPKWGESANLIWAAPTGLFVWKILAVSGKVRQRMFVYKPWGDECWDAFSPWMQHNALTTLERWVTNTAGNDWS